MLSLVTSALDECLTVAIVNGMLQASFVCMNPGERLRKKIHWPITFCNLNSKEGYSLKKRGTGRIVSHQIEEP